MRDYKSWREEAEQAEANAEFLFVEKQVRSLIALNAAKIRYYLGKELRWKDRPDYAEGIKAWRTQG